MNAGPTKEHPAEIRYMLHDACFCIVAARFNDEIVSGLIEGARRALLGHDVAESAIDILRVPGAFELPLAALGAAKTRRYDGIVALAAIIRGETPHFEYVSAESVAGLGRVSLEQEIPIGMGVLTVNTVDQAADRSSDDAANKGSEAALAAMEMIRLFRDLGA